MHRFYLPPENCRGTILTLLERDAHHAMNVLRIKSRERVAVLNGAGDEFDCEVTSASKKSVQLSVLEKKIHPPPPFQITLIQAIPKGKMMDWIIEKATELGAARIIPLLAERVVTRLDAHEAGEKRDKWQHIAIEAIKQCGQPWLPRVETPLMPKDFVARGEKFELPLVGSLQSDSLHPRKFFRRFSETNKRPPQSVAIWVGPEGDFTPEEMELIKSSGGLPITLGPLVLRCETAAMYCLAIANYEMR
jgi:16S rRNA (uracil1498-N3)-methyltransferase